MEAQRIIITGGATRIGAAIAEKLSGSNKQIVIQYNKSKSKAENLKKKLQTNVYFFMGNFDDEAKDKFSHLKEGEVILIENKYLFIFFQNWKKVYFFICNFRIRYSLFKEKIMNFFFVKRNSIINFLIMPPSLINYK